MPVPSALLLHLHPRLQDGSRMQGIGFMVFSKNLSFIRWLSGQFLDVPWSQELVLRAAIEDTDSGI